MYLAKGKASAVALLITAAAFLAASLVALTVQFGSDVNLGHFLLLFVVFPLMQLFFLVLGMTGRHPGSTLERPAADRARHGLRSLRHRVVRQCRGQRGRPALSPYKYFPSGDVLSGRGYAPSYAILYVVLFAVLGVVGFFRFVRKDVPTAR